ncbi:hypothetical protein FIBSPDRAFT_369885 [Athelia psychrophila]|uniref:Uncharacterized protein n=1 Tax=Athelia psychrophila TaxID=1759441 RepID=A0A167VHD6_9AGAM|nr:hypothetical protein FIBSPDRAFT_369885 [Fibularhizoctonia sp. CBS 109695]
MAEVFGADRRNRDAKEWVKHWAALEIFEEENRDDLSRRDPPKRPWHSSDGPTLSQPEGDVMDVDALSIGPSPSAPGVSLQLLQESSVVRETERELRRHNGNISPRNPLKTGAKFDAICAALVIEVVELSAKNKATTYFYCIACDERRANNSRS